MPAKILNVDDNEVNRYLRTQILSTAGYTVIEAEGGQKAITLCREERPELVLLDINMPDLNGIEVCRRIKGELDSNRPVLVIQISATHTETDDQVRGLEGGADGYLTEPVPAPLLLATVRSMLRLHAAERALRDRDARLRRLVDSNVVGICIANNSGVRDANEEFLRIVGMTTKDLVAGQVDWRSVTPPEHLPRDEKALVELRATGCCVPFEKDYLRSDGSRIPVLLGAAVLASDPLEWICFVVDLSKQKEVERQLQARTEQLARSNVQLEQFGYVVSHDLQSPLRTITTMTQMLSRKYSGSLDPETTQLFEFIQQAVQRMNRLICDLLDYSRIDKVDSGRRPAASSAYLALALSNLQTQISETQASVYVENELPEVMAGEHLARVFQNLIGNAVKYRGERDLEIRIRAMPAADEWIFSVQDNGIGFEMEYAEKIFDAFHRLHPMHRYEGTGIGLAISRRILERYGGRIWAESQPGIGSTFYFALPACPSSQA